ncbi:MAG: hypothetical protein H8D43_04385 [Chloroflexi bacterium]|nr:hypothetical protein [Chloroflexota bacterium]
MRASRFETCYQLIGPGDCTASVPFTDIAASVLVKAIADWRMHGGETELPDKGGYRYWLDRRGFRSPRQELLRFFKSDWCEFLVGAVVDMPHDDFLRAVGVI